MTDTVLDAYATLIEPATLKIERLLPGPAQRIWDYLTQSDLRRLWLASGDMGHTVGAPFELTWRNDELTTPSGTRPEGFPEIHTMQSRIIEIDPPHKLVFSWGVNGTGEVSFELTPQGNEVLLTAIHKRLPEERSTRLNIGAGWHSHIDLLVALITGTKPAPVWDHWASLRQDYEHRLPE
jgi:uncharacterized protein YndB with AHSA1/START domain